MTASGVGIKSRLWQRTMIGAARSTTLQAAIQSNRFFNKLSRRYVGGADCGEALTRVAGMAQSGLTASPYYLGEYVDTPELVERNVVEIIAAINAFDQTEPPVFFSVDPTQIGYTVSDELGQTNALRIAEEIGRNRGIRFMMIDMEDASYVDRTIALYRNLKLQGVRVAITLQAYLRRTEADFEQLATSGRLAVRFVKGAFVADKKIAWTVRNDIDASYERLARRAFAPEMKASGVYPIIATHDSRIINALKPVIRANGWKCNEYEIEMLLGVRESLQKELVSEGYNVRVYVPYGTAWWSYTARRIGENPANLRFLLKAMIGC